MISSRLEECLIKLDEVNKELQNLVSRSSIFGQYTIEFAKAFVDQKSGHPGKAPSDEYCKQLVLSKDTMATTIQQYHELKFKLDIYLEISRNLRKKCDALKGSEQEENATNKMFS